MKKLGFDALRNAKCVALFALLSVLVIPTAPSFAGNNSQMLPPTRNDGTNTVCDTSSGAMLQWDGSGNIVCIPQINGDANGNVTIAHGHSLNFPNGLNANGP